MKDVENCKILTIVEKFLISPHDICEKLKFTLFCCKISWLAVYAVSPWNLFCRDLHAFCVEKNFSQKCAMWRKNDKYDVLSDHVRQPKHQVRQYWFTMSCCEAISIANFTLLGNTGLTNVVVHQTKINFWKVVDSRISNVLPQIFPNYLIWVCTVARCQNVRMSESEKDICRN